jgi:hypothetical protein
VLILPPSPPANASDLSVRRAQWMAASDSDDDKDTYDGEEIPEVEIGISTTIVSSEQVVRVTE